MITVNLEKTAIGTAVVAPITVNLNKESATVLNKVKFLLNWDEHPVHGKSLGEGFDLDIWAIGLVNGKLTSGDHICYYGSQKIFGGAVDLASGDNRFGSGKDDEFIIVDLAGIPSNITGLVFFVFIHDAPARAQHFGMVPNARVEVINAETNEILAKNNITQEFSGQTAVCVGTLEGSTWISDGQGGTLTPNEVLGYYQ